MLSKILISIVSNLLFLQLVLSQNNDTSFKVNYWGDYIAYQEAQTKHSLDLVENILTNNKPSFNKSKIRDAAFSILDNVLHQTNAADLESVQEFYHKRISILFDKLNESVVENEIRIFKLYNHGFIIKTSTFSVAFDLTRGYSSNSLSFAINDSLTKKLIEKIDVLFVSHLHIDHADEWVIREFIKQNKIVVSPDNILIDKEYYSKIKHPNRSIQQLHSIKLNESKKIDFLVMPGHQYSLKNKTSVLNNIYLIKTNNGKSILHTGDQYSFDDFKWIDSLKLSSRVDIVLPNSWSLELPRLLKPLNPQIIITGHENEIGHTLDHREPYFLNKSRLGIFYRKFIQLTWGEYFSFR